MASMDQSMPLPNLEDNNQGGVYAACCICLPIAFITVVLRFVARRLSGAEVRWDDWYVVTAMVGAIGFFVSTIVLLKNGMGKHFQTATPEQYTSFAKTYIPAACFYAVGIAMTKMSLLAFYQRIFASRKSIRLPIYVLSFVVSGWMVAVILVSIFSCTPVAYWWDRTIPNGHCVDNTAFLLGNSIPNICTDFFILILPMPYVWTLNQSLRRKIAVSGLFLLGGFVCIITIVRLVIQLNTDFTSPDLTWNITEFVKWTNVEVSLAIVSACLPNLRPIVSWVRNGGQVTQAGLSHGSSKAPATLDSGSHFGGHVHLSIGRSDKASMAETGEANEYPLVDQPKGSTAMGRAL